MGETRARSKGTGGAPLPMTRRQQKRARQRAPQPAQRATRSPKPAATASVAAPASTSPVKTADQGAPRVSRATKPTADAARPRRTGTISARTLAEAIERRPAQQSRPAARTLRPARPPRARQTSSTLSTGDEPMETPSPDAQGADSLVALPAEEREDGSIPEVAAETTTQTTRTRKYPTLAKIAAVRRPARTEAEPADANTAQPDAPSSGDDLESGIASDAPAGAADEVETRPMRARRPAVTRRLQATRDDAAIASFREQAREAEPREEAAQRPHGTRPRPLAEVDLTLPVAGAHAAIAAVAALVGATLLVQGASGAIWPLTLTAIAGSGGWLGYVLGQQSRSRRAAGLVLTLSQVGVLVWLMLLIGPRGALVAVAPAIALLALRLSGLLAAVASGVLVLGAYLTLSLLAIGRGIQPVVRLSRTPGVLLDAAIVSVGVGVSLLALNLWHRQHARLDQQARGRLREARALRTQSTQDQRRLAEDLQSLEDALTEALRGQGAPALRVTPELEAVAERVTLVAERLRTLQLDREDRLRVEGALRSLIREVERAWLGLPWAWPAPSGTTLDELIALLRAPRSHEAPASWPDETPTLVPIPSTISQPSRPWDVVSPSELTRNSRPRDALFSQLPLGLDDSDGSRPIPAHVSQLPWRDWDMWRDWDPNKPYVVGE